MDITEEKPYCPSLNDIGTLSNRQVRALIDHYHDDLFGHLWFCLCLGLRRAEASKVDKLTCRDNYLIVDAEAAKTKTRRPCTWDIPQLCSTETTKRLCLERNQKSSLRCGNKQGDGFRQKQSFVLY